MLGTPQTSPVGHEPMILGNFPCGLLFYTGRKVAPSTGRGWKVTVKEPKKWFVTFLHSLKM